MTRVLFVCIHNSARSQMAEAFLNQLGAGRYVAESAGIESGKLNPLVVRSMAELGINMSSNRTKTVADVLAQGRQYDVVITVCDAANAERCPVFPGNVKRLAWFFDDPSALQGTEEEKLARIAEIRDEIREKVKQYLSPALSEGEGGGE